MDSGIARSEIRAIVADAFVFAYPMLFNYKTLYAQAVDATSPQAIPGFGRFRHYARAYTPDDTDIVTPNNDTPYSWAWLDLRAEPWVLSVPAVPGDRYVVFQWIDLFTFNFAYVGVRSTGCDAGDYLFATRAWDGEVPPGIKQVFRSETDVILTLTRTGLDGPDDVPNVQALQAQYRLRPLSEVAGTAAPAPAPAIDWPAWDEAKATGEHFGAYLNLLLGLCQPPDPSEVELLERFARVGIGPALPWDPAALDPETREAVRAGVAEGRERLADAVAATHSSEGLFGTRAMLGNDYLKRAVAAAAGIYGNNAEEALYIGWHADDHSEQLSGECRYRLHFPAGGLPPVSGFWSVTMYRLPERLLAANPIDRYAIGDRTPGLVLGDDGSLTIAVQRDRPADPAEAANWLPAPDGPFNCVFRLYGPGPEILDGTWQEPPMIRVE